MASLAEALSHRKATRHTRLGKVFRVLFDLLLLDVYLPVYLEGDLLSHVVDAILGGSYTAAALARAQPDVGEADAAFVFDSLACLMTALASRRGPDVWGIKDPDSVSISDWIVNHVATKAARSQADVRDFLEGRLSAVRDARELLQTKLRKVFIESEGSPSHHADELWLCRVVDEVLRPHQASGAPCDIIPVEGASLGDLVSFAARGLFAATGLRGATQAGRFVPASADVVVCVVIGGMSVREIRDIQAKIDAIAQHGETKPKVSFMSTCVTSPKALVRMLYWAPLIGQ